MTAMGVRCIQPTSPTAVKKEEDVVGVLFVQQLSTEKKQPANVTGVHNVCATTNV